MRVGVVAPGLQGGGQGGDDALLVGRVGYGGWILAGNEQRSYFDRDGGAHEIVQRADRGLTGECGETGFGECGGEVAGEALALADGSGLGGVPGDGDE